MRKWLILMVTAAVGLVFAGRGRPGAAPQPNAEDILFLRWDGGITLVRDLPEGTAVRLPRAVPSTDWSVVVRAVPQGHRGYADVLSLKPVQFRYKDFRGFAAGPMRRGLIYEDSPSSIQGAGSSIVIDERLVNLELALKHAMKRLEILQNRLKSLESGQ